MKIFVISLKTALKRRAQIDAQLKRLGLSYEMVDAVDGRALTEEELKELTHYESVERDRKWLNNGAIGCALSHLKAYQRIVEEGVPFALVLEDDALLQDNFLSFLEGYEAAPPPMDIILLFFMSWKECVLRRNGKVAVGSTHVYQPENIHQPVASTAYIITGEAAGTMLDKLRPVRSASDSWGTFHALGAFRSMGCVYPVTVIEDDLKSTINYVHVKYAGLFHTIDRYRIFPLYQLLKMKRKFNRERMMQVRIK